MGKRIAINGLGRIGRATLKLLLHNEDAEVVAANDLAPVKTLAHLLKYDSIHGISDLAVEYSEDQLVIGGNQIKFYSENDPVNLPWGDLDVDLVIECTGIFRNRELASKHLDAGAKKVLLSAPPGGKDIKSVVLGINDNILDGTEDIISNASCTTNCAAPMVKVVDELCGIESAFISTIHAYTSDQRLHDAPHKDLRRARAAAVSIVPTTTGAAKAITRIFPHLHGKMGGCGIRVPVPDGSLTDISFIVSKDLTVEKINEAFRNAANGELKGILQYEEDPIVSVDIVGNPHSCILDADLTAVVGKMVKVVGWYDNEMGYSNRLAELAMNV